jgi:hypothetical protein
MEIPMRRAREEARCFIESVPVNRAVLLGHECFNGWLICALAPGYDEKIESKLLSAEILSEGEESTRALRLYATRLELGDWRDLGNWD